PELHDAACGLRVGCIAAWERRDRSVDECEALTRVGGKINDDIGTLPWSQKEGERGMLLVVEFHGPVEQAAVSADLPEGRASAPVRCTHQTHLVEASIRSIDDAEAVAAWLDIKIRPCLAIHYDDIPKEFRYPV